MTLSVLATIVLSALTVSTGAASVQIDNVARDASSGTAVVDLASPQSTPQHLASGFIYGIPDAPNQIPSHFYTDIGFRYTRAAGAQLPAPARGWIHGTTEFQVFQNEPFYVSKFLMLLCLESL